ncbi:hypothetical protein MalM25_07190 [Planctomycetes bacterium MalM25]|nr:hypothetical protein MalM25_07190 [Planctomycetes bacterium MalM25]
MRDQSNPTAISSGFFKHWLAKRSERVTTSVAVVAAFSAYFSMYAFRKPFAAATYESEGVEFLGALFGLKTLYVVSQVLGYALSKYLGIRVCSQTQRGTRFRLLVGLILAAEAALLAFALTPEDAVWLKALALFANGLPLGMVWGTVVLYLEGRRASEVLMTGLSCSFIVASGVVKDLGRALLAGADFPIPFAGELGWALPNPFPATPEYWMPAATGALFLAPLLVSAWVLEQVPDPNEQDRAERVERCPMGRSERAAFLRRFALGVFVAIGAYVALTAFRDYRDTYAVELFTELGYDYANNKTAVSQAELLVAFGVMGVLSQLFRIRDNRRALLATYALMAGGLLLAGGATALLDAGHLDGFWWMTLIGLGGYLAYVPFNSVLFDRVIATTGFSGTAVFGIYLADAAGYTGTVALLLGKDVFLAGSSPVVVVRAFCYALATLGVAALALSCFAFVRTPPVRNAQTNNEASVALR